MQKIKTEYKSIFSNIFFQVQKHLTRRKKQIPLCLLVRKRQCLSHFFNYGRVEVGKSYSGWDAFVKQNENRIKK